VTIDEEPHSSEMISLDERIPHPLRPVARPRIAVLDDLFPHPMSGIRFEEFSSYLDEMPEVSVSVHCNGNAFHLVGGARPVEDIIAEHFAAHPHHIGRIHPLFPDQLPDADAYYTVFLHNTARYFDAIERSKKPFAFTLYPGGGFRVGDKWTDDWLERVCNSPYLRRIIVTQRHTLDYLLKRHALSESKIYYVHGGVIPRLAFCAPKSRKHFGIDKEVLEIGFVANRYTPNGQDKGYDLFVETARALSRNGVNAVYHVVGPWEVNIVPLDDLSGRFVFHGFVSTEKLRELGQALDLILSPNRPDTLAAGAFDGFPTGSCVEAGLQEAAIFCTDVLKVNTEYRDGIDLVLVEPSVDDIVRRLLPIIEERGALAQIGRNGRRRLTEIFGRETQLPPRLAVLRALVMS
jgi:glycosyltransferase involved in cell wall biosynthesis